MSWPDKRVANAVAVVCLVALMLFCLAWELWLAPLHAGGSTLALKALPLLLPLFGLLRGRRYTHQWTSLLALAYLTEALVRIGSDPPAQRWAAAVELLLALALFSGCIAFVKASASGARTTTAG